MQLVSLLVYTAFLLPGFNPHPAFWPDATTIVSRYSVQILMGFNPHPAFWPDATNQVGFNEDGTSVSILIRPEGRMQRDEGCLCGDCGYDVSILIRPSGRMQRGILLIPTG